MVLTDDWLIEVVDAYMRQQTGPLLLQIMACRLVDTETSSK